MSFRFYARYLSTARNSRGVSSSPRRVPAPLDGTPYDPNATSLGLKAKKEGDISSVFASLSEESSLPLPQKFVDLKREIVDDHLDRLYDSWKNLLPALKEDVEIIREKGNKVVPIIDFVELRSLSEARKNDIRNRGVCIIKGVFTTGEALAFKRRVKEYIRANPNTKGFPAEQPQVFELYWSPSQVEARADPRMLSLQSYFLSLWHSTDTTSPSDLTSLVTPLTYADRFRIRLPGDAKFALGPHVDGGGVERWEDPVYRSCYSKIFEGKWREYDPFELGGRTREGLRMNMYECAGGCSMFRAWQGWLSMSFTGPSQGTLRVLPLTKTSTAYWLLRPFFDPSSPSSPMDTTWEPTPHTPFLHGSTPGRGQEMSEDLHPHLELKDSVISIPRVEPGDIVMWQGDLIHAVEGVHSGDSDSSVMYIPAAPGIPMNRTYVLQQRESFLAGFPPPGFPGGKGESEHVGRATEDNIGKAGGQAGLRAMGFEL